jgi:drug/metabolite transporter superfamily protein YnfA
MIVDIFNKVLIFLFILSILNVIRNCFFIIRSYRDKERFMLGKGSLIALGVSIAYIITVIIEGVNL